MFLNDNTIVINEKEHEMAAIEYRKFEAADLGDVLGWKSAAGYLEGKITRVDRMKKTACKKTFSDWVMIEVLPYFARFEGETAYLNANFLMGQGELRIMRREAAYEEMF